MYVVFVEFDRNQYSVNEDDGSVLIRVVLNEAPGVTVNAMVTTTDITATSKYVLPITFTVRYNLLDGSDYVGGQFPVRFSATQQMQTFTIRIIDNDIVENNELFRLTLTAEGLLAVGRLGMATVNITDDEGMLVHYVESVIYSHFLKT